MYSNPYCQSNTSRGPGFGGSAPCIDCRVSIVSRVPPHGTRLSGRVSGTASIPAGVGGGALGRG